jgi:two-component system chemotaxis response regulator CheB
VLVAEDSPTTRALLVALLEADPAVTVVGAVVDGGQAVDQTRALRPDVVVMDIEMPRIDGYEATRRIMSQVPTPIVMVSGHAGSLESRAFEALAAGALVLIGKPAGTRDLSEVRRLVDTVRLMAEVRVVRRWERASRAAAAAPCPVSAAPQVRVVAIGASAGGPPVVAEILAALPASFACPVLLVQHIAEGFANGLAVWLDRATGLTVRLAEHGEPLRRGTVYVAPDGRQMGVDLRGRVELTDGPAADGFRPSASHLMRSVARSYGRGAGGVLLTGMGRDGAAGLLELRRRGGVTIAQDEASSVVFGMPGEAVRIGAAEHVMPPHRIAEALTSLATADARADQARSR